MLGKLIKYEFQAGSRYYLPLFILIAIAALFCRLMSSLAPATLLEFMVSAIFALLLTAMFVITFVITIQRFYKNLLGAEGYLMFTLPVSVHSHLLSKLTAAMVWNCACLLMLVLSVDIAGREGSLFGDMLRGLPADLSALGDLLLVLLIGLLSLAAALLFFYLAMAIGQLFGQQRLLASFGAVIVMSIAQQILLVAAVAVGFNLLAFNSLLANIDPDNIGALATGGVIAALLAVCAVYYFLTHWLLNKKLNLQ
ncbi:MAG: hypothetical protein Q4B96_07470 [Bacillota bacterium]|nr:hypothetical protein [Bacillota bacterium]